MSNTTNNTAIAFKVTLKFPKRDAELRRFSGSDFERFDDIHRKITQLWQGVEPADADDEECGESAVAVRQQQKKLQQKRPLVIEYIDEESDVIAVHSDLEWREALRLHRQCAPIGTALRITVRRASNKEAKVLGAVVGPTTASKTTRRDERQMVAQQPKPSPRALNPSEQNDNNDDDDTRPPTTGTASPAEPPASPAQAVGRPRSSSFDHCSSASSVSRAASSFSHVVPVSSPKTQQRQPTDDGKKVVVTAATRREQDVLSLLSALYGRDASVDLVAHPEAFAPAVTRSVDSQTLEVTVDIDRLQLRNLAVNKGNALIERSEFSAARDLLTLSVRVFEDSAGGAAVFNYNLACAHALDEASGFDYKEQAIMYLERAVAQGFDDFEAIRSDFDLLSLHGTEGFDRVLTSLAPKAVEEEQPSIPRVDSALDDVDVIDVDTLDANDNDAAKKDEEAVQPVVPKLPLQSTEPTPVEVPQQQQAPPAVTVSENAETLAVIFPGLRAVEAQAILDAHQGSLSKAVNSLVDWQR